MKSIWKFEVPLKEKFTITMPKGMQIITFQMQRESPCIWGIVDLGTKSEMRAFAIRGTGHEFENDPGTYIGTVQMSYGALVWHLFEIT